MILKQKKQIELISDDIKKIKGAIVSIGSNLNKKFNYKIMTGEEYQKLISSIDSEKLSEKYTFIKSSNAEGAIKYIALDISKVSGYSGLLRGIGGWSGGSLPIIDKDINAYHPPERLKDAPYSQYEVLYSDYARLKDEYYWLERRVKKLEEEIRSNK